MIQPEDLAAIPVEHRRTIARWLVELADRMQPSWVMTSVTADAVADVLKGVAVDLTNPTAEDSTVRFAAETLAGLRSAVHPHDRS